MSLIQTNPLKTASYIVKNTDLLNAVVLQINNVFDISGSVISDSSYNGEIDLWIKKDDNTYAFVVTLVNGASQKFKIMSGNRTGGNLLESNDDKTPYTFRIIVGTKATLGTATIRMNYL